MGDTASLQTTSESTAPAHAYDLFVVHAADDAEFVHGYLLPALNLPSSRVLRVDQLPLGGMIVAEIDRAVSQSRFTVAVLSPAYLADRWAAFGEQLASHLSVDATRVIPLRLAACEVPLRLDARVSLDFTEQARWEAEAGRLRELLRAQPPVPEPIACPYPGMRAFGTEDFCRFFGRDWEVDDLVGRLDRDERTIYVIGPSGSGKSSLVQAGLLHRLDAGSSRLGRTFAVRTMRPGERPAERLAHALDGDLETPARAVDAFVARNPPARRALVFIDQLEELFTLASDNERKRFIAVVQALLAETRCCFVLALRADFYGALMDSELWPPRTVLPRLDVAPLRGDALAAAIVEPALRVGVHLEARLRDRMIADAAGEPGVLPLVQETLRMLWDKRRRSYLGLVEYERLGRDGRGLDVAIALRANTAMNELTAAQQAIARRVLLRLVSFGEGRADTRRQLGRQALCSAAGDDVELSAVLQHLVEHRLITVDGDLASERSRREALVDLSHEALITGWQEFRRWIGERRADEQRRRRLDSKVSEWIDRGRGTASLLDAVELAEAVAWMESDAARELGCPAELAALVAASRNALDQAERARRERTRELHRLLGASYMEQGRALLLGGHPMQALPYLVAARTEAEKAEETVSPALRMLFAQASRNLPLVTLIGHRSAIMTVAFNADGTRVVTASNDKTARVWDTTTGTLVTGPLAHQGRVNTAVFSPDGMRIVTASDDTTVRVWAATAGAPLTGPPAFQGKFCVAVFSPDGTRVLTASEDGTARVWDAKTLTPVTMPLQHKSWVMAAAFSADGARVVTASFDKTARVWDAMTGQPVTGPLAHQDPVRAAAFSPDGTRVVTASSDGTARVWDAATGRPVTQPLVHQDIVYTAAFSANGTRVVTASGDKTARVWDATTGTPVTGPLMHHNAVLVAAFSADGTRVVTASTDRTARVWDATTGRPVTGPLEHVHPVHAAVFSADGTRVATASGDKGRVWDPTKGEPVSRLLEHLDFVSTATFSADGTRVVTASFDHTARVWDAATGASVTGPLAHREAVWVAAFSPDGTRVVTASGNTAWVWDVTTNTSVAGPLEHMNTIHVAAFSADGTRVVTASRDKTARVWNATTGTPLTGLLAHGETVCAVVFSPDGARVATASWDYTARVWDATTGIPLTGPLVHHGGVNAIAFSPDGRRVVTASDDYTACVWDAATGVPVAGPLKHEGQVKAAAFSADGARVVTASDDYTACVWDAMTGAPLTAPLEHQGTVWAAAFSADGTCVVTASADRTAQVWNATTGTRLTVPLEHRDAVHAAAFSPDGTRVVTASSDNTARVWTLPTDMGSIEDWQMLARCCPFVLSGSVLAANPDAGWVSGRTSVDVGALE